MSNDEWTKAWPSNMTAPWPVSPKWSDHVEVAIPNWPRAIKELEDAGESHPVFVIPNSVALNSQKLGRIERSNKVPTHDPYTNLGALIYYECKCGSVLDPGTKSFAALNNAAMDAGWKIRFGEHHYQAHCVECGKGVE